MAWRPYENLIDGYLSNREPGKVIGWIRFFRRGMRPLKVRFDLDGDFHEDIRGKDIVLQNPEPSDKNASLERAGTYMEGFVPLQRGNVGDMTAGLPLGPWTEDLARHLKAQREIVWQGNGITGAELEERRRDVDAEYAENIRTGELYYPYVAYPYLEWYADNGRVVLELDPSQVIVVDGKEPIREKTDQELAADRKRRSGAFGQFMTGMVKEVSESNRKAGGDGTVTGIVIG